MMRECRDDVLLGPPSSSTPLRGLRGRSRVAGRAKFEWSRRDMAGAILEVLLEDPGEAIELVLELVLVLDAMVQGSG